MKNRASSHLLVLLIIIGFEIVGYTAVHRAALTRGYETSWIGGIRDLLLYLPIVLIVFWLTRVMKFAGNWTLYTSAILLFSIGLLVQYRLYSDPEYNTRNKAAARQEKTDTLRMRYINQTYDANKRQMMGLPPTPPPADVEAPAKPSSYTVQNALTSSYTWIPILSLVSFGLAFSF